MQNEWFGRKLSQDLKQLNNTALGAMMNGRDNLLIISLGRLCRTSRQVRFLCPWARHLKGRLVWKTVARAGEGWAPPGVLAQD